MNSLYPSLRSKSKVSVIAGILFLLYPVLSFFEEFLIVLSPEYSFISQLLGQLESFFDYYVSWKPFEGLFLLGALILGILLLVQKCKRCIPVLLCLYVVRICLSVGGFAVWGIIVGLLRLFAAVLICSFSFFLFSSIRSGIKKLWFVPAVLEGIRVLYGCIEALQYDIPGISVGRMILLYCLSEGAFVLAMGFLGRWLCSLSEEASEKALEEAADGERTLLDTSFYLPLWLHITLLIFGNLMWVYVWCYLVTEHLNCAPNQKYRSPASQLLLCIFVPFYYFYWLYQSAKRVSALSSLKFRFNESDFSVLTVVLAVFLGIAAPIFMQYKLNEIYK